MSEGFKPGVDAARLALGANIPIVHNVHPGGAKGVALSLKECADRIRKGRNDPRVRAWAIRSVKAAGGPQGTREQAQAILSALKQATVYVQDPVNTEFIQAAHETLCLDEKNGLCFRGGDCDDLVVAYGSATLSIGIPTQIIGEAFNFNPTPSHVLIAIQDTRTNEWLRVDPSTDKPVGEYVVGTKEEWIDPMAPSNSAGVAGNDGSGDFVGIGRVGALSAAATTAPSSSGSSGGLWVIGALAVAAIGVYAYVQSPEFSAERVDYKGVPIKIMFDHGWVAKTFGQTFKGTTRANTLTQAVRYINSELKRVYGTTRPG